MAQRQEGFDALLALFRENQHQAEEHQHQECAQLKVAACLKNTIPGPEVFCERHREK